MTDPFVFLEEVDLWQGQEEKRQREPCRNGGDHQWNPHRWLVVKSIDRQCGGTSAVGGAL